MVIVRKFVMIVASHSIIFRLYKKYCNRIEIWARSASKIFAQVYNIFAHRALYLQSKPIILFSGQVMFMLMEKFALCGNIYISTELSASISVIKWDALFHHCRTFIYHFSLLTATVWLDHYFWSYIAIFGLFQYFLLVAWSIPQNIA